MTTIYRVCSKSVIVPLDKEDVISMGIHLGYRERDPFFEKMKSWEFEDWINSITEEKAIEILREEKEKLGVANEQGIASFYFESMEEALKFAETL